MHWLTRLRAALTLIVTLHVVVATCSSDARAAQDESLRALDGEWIYVEDRTSRILDLLRQ